MKVAILLQWDLGSGETFLGSLEEVLLDRGATVSRFTGQGPSGEDFVRHRWRKSVREADGKKITRYPYFHSHDGSTLRRLATYGTFAARSALSFRDLAEADVVLAYCSPATAVSAALLARRFSHVPYVMMVQDVWPDSIFATGFLDTGVARRVAEGAVNRFVNGAYRSSSAITTLSPGMRQLLVNRGADPRKTHVLYNWARHEKCVTPRVRKQDEPLHLMYAGNMGTGQNLTNVLEAMSRVPQESVRLTLVGGGADVPNLKRTATAMGLSNVEFHHVVREEQMPDVLAKADLHLVSLADQDIFKVTIPSKLQSLMAMGLPILGVAPGEVSDIVVTTGCGIAVPPNDPTALAAAIAAACLLLPGDLADMGANGAENYYAEMAMEIGAERLFTILASAAHGAALQ